MNLTLLKASAGLQGIRVLTSEYSPYIDVNSVCITAVKSRFRSLHLVLHLNFLYNK